MKEYIVYDIKENEQVRFIGTLAEIKREIQATGLSFQRALSRNNLIHGRYELVEIEE